MTVIRWLGQACFVIVSVMGTHILIDPPHPDVGYSITANSIPADLVLVSHEHFDHNFVEAAEGKPQILQPLTRNSVEHATFTHSVNGDEDKIGFTRIFSYHDNEMGALRGGNTISLLKVDGLRICHMGDIGELALTPEQIHEIGHVDVLMIPVGGTYTVDAQEAVVLINELHPRVIIPMHYQTPALNADLHSHLHPVSEFVDAISSQAAIVNIDDRDLKLSPATLPERQLVYLLRYQ